MKLKHAFDLNRGDVVSLIGAGGKTSLLVSMGYELAEAGWRVLATTTTQLSEEQLGLIPCNLKADADAALISEALNNHNLSSCTMKFAPAASTDRPWSGRNGC